MCSQLLAQTEPPVSLAVQRTGALVPASGRVPGAVARSKAMEGKTPRAGADVAPSGGSAHSRRIRNRRALTGCFAVQARRGGSERRLAELYNKWFLRRLPTGETLNLPISPRLEEVFRMLGQTD
jgi:hypothetical protein